MIRLGVKFGDVQMVPSNPLHVSILLYLMKSSNMAHLRRLSFDMRCFDANDCLEEFEAAHGSFSLLNMAFLTKLFMVVKR